MAVIRRKIKFIVFLVIFVVVSPIIVLYANGDIFTSGFSLLKTGGIYVNTAPIGSQVFLNSKLVDETSFFNRDILIKNLRVGTYNVSVKKDGYNTWTKTIRVQNNIVSDANVFMLTKQSELREITSYILIKNGTSTMMTKKKNQEYADISAIFASTTRKAKIVSTTTIDLKSNFGTKNAPIMDGKLGLWNEEGDIFIGWFGREDGEPKYFCDGSGCKTKLLVYSFGSSPTRIDFLPGYENAIVFAFGGDIFAVQIEENPKKFAQLIYHGNSPDFRVSDGSLYIKDRSYVAEVIL
ncbi:MAG: PEGA domain-containing protein [Candidatus Paceibacterota bacterium]|jgi:hypothetical protein